MARRGPTMWRTNVLRRRANFCKARRPCALGRAASALISRASDTARPGRVVASFHLSRVSSLECLVSSDMSLVPCVWLAAIKSKSKPKLNLKPKASEPLCVGRAAAFCPRPGDLPGSVSVAGCWAQQATSNKQKVPATGRLEGCRRPTRKSAGKLLSLGARFVSAIVADDRCRRPD